LPLDKQPLITYHNASLYLFNLANSHARLTDLTGRTLLSFPVLSDAHWRHTSLSPGIYLLYTTSTPSPSSPPRIFKFVVE
jgi:hypothetical protein